MCDKNCFTTQLLIMNKIFRLFLAVLVLAAACKKDKDAGPMARFEISDSKSALVGSLLRGMPVTAANTFSIAFKNAPANTTATVSAEAVNGISIPATTITMEGSGTVNVPIAGTPVTDSTYILVVKVKTGEINYVCTKEFYVDEPNVSAITFNLAETPVNEVKDSVKVNFDINPKTTQFAIVAPAHLAAEIVSTGARTRILKITADGQFIAGDVVVTASFMSLPAVTKTIRVSAFSGGDGSVNAPFEISDTARLNRIQYAPDKAYKLTADLVQVNSTAGAVIFTGSLDGNGKKISNTKINAATADNKGYFGEIGAGGIVKNLVLNAITVAGKDYTAAVAGINRGTITNVTVSGSVTGNTFAGGIAGNNYGTISGCDINNVTISGTNQLGSLAGKTNTGSAETGNVALVVPTSFPTEVYGISSAKTADFAFAPSDGTLAVVTAPTGLTATPVAGQQKITLTPAAGFITGDLQLNLLKNKMTVARSVKVYSKTQGSLFDGGDGSAASPYLVSTEAALNAIRNDVAKNYKLIADITVANAWTAIPTFSGSIDGDGNAVNSLNMTTTVANDGFINTNTGTIKNIRFLNVNCTTSAAFGVVAGKNNGGTIQNVVVSGTVTSTNTGDVLGGIAGELAAGGKITQCCTKLTMVASCGMVGGIAARLTTAAGQTAEISYCTTTGSIEINAAKNRIGGILGRAEGSLVSGGIVKNCLCTMTLTSTGANAANVNGIGGIFGADQNASIVPIDQCAFTGTITAGFSIGGIAGVGSSITNCLVAGQGASLSSPMLRSTGTPSTGNVAGIAGTNKTKLSNCVVKNATIKAATTTSAMAAAGIVSTFQNNGYAVNNVVVNTSVEGSTVSPGWDFVFRIAGTAGSSPGNSGNYAGDITLPFRTTTVTSDAAGLDGQLKTKAELTQSFLQSAGFDFGVWKIDTDGYPALRNAGYNGTLPTPL